MFGVVPTLASKMILGTAFSVSMLDQLPLSDVVLTREWPTGPDTRLIREHHDSPRFFADTLKGKEHAVCEIAKLTMILPNS